MLNSGGLTNVLLHSLTTADVQAENNLTYIFIIIIIISIILFVQ